MHFTVFPLGLQVLPDILTDQLQHHPATIQHPQGPDSSYVGSQDIRSVNPGVEQLGIQHLFEAGCEVGGGQCAPSSPSGPSLLAGSLGT